MLPEWFLSSDGRETVSGDTSRNEKVRPDAPGIRSWILNSEMWRLQLKLHWDSTLKFSLFSFRAMILHRRFKWYSCQNNFHVIHFKVSNQSWRFHCHFERLRQTEWKRSDAGGAAIDLIQKQLLAFGCTRIQIIPEQLVPILLPVL